MTGERSSLPPRVIATSCVLFHRFYCRNSFVQTDPWLLIPTSLCLSSKVEEHTVHQCQIEIVINALTTINHLFSYTAKDINRCELQLLHHLDYQLIVFHPHPSLTEMIEDAEFPEGLEVASALLNDSYQSDVCLRHFPYQIALGCVFVSAIILGLKEKLKPWVTSLNVEMERIGEVSKDLIALYGVWREWDEAKVAEIDRKVREMRTRT